MKKLSVITLAVVTAVFMFSCKGDIGPAGAAGVDGTDGTVVEFQNGMYPAASYAGCEDNTMISNSNTYNHGACEYLITGYYDVTSNIYRALVKFDLTYIVPGNVDVKSAQLNFKFDSSDDTTGTTTVTAYAVTKPWTEGDSVCAGAADVYSSWMYYNGTANLWDTNGGDYSGTPLTDSVVVSDDAYGFTLTFNAAGRAAIENWISDPSQNMGIILIAAVESGSSSYWIRPCSSEIAEITNRPKLTVSYLLP